METVINGLRTNYLVSGRGRDVIVLQGWGTSVELYSDLCAHLSAYMRVWIPDLPGAGRTAEPAAPMCADDYADFVCLFAERMGLENVSLIGHSNGGRVAIKLAARKDSGLIIDKMALMGCAGIVHEKTPGQLRKAKLYKAGKSILGSAPVRLVFPNALENFKRRQGSDDYRRASPVMRDTLVRLVNEDLRALLPQIKQPTLLIFGENDTATPLSDGELMEKLIPDAGLVRVAGAGHYAYLEQPGLIYRVLDSFFGGKV